MACFASLQITVLKQNSVYLFICLFIYLFIYLDIYTYFFTISILSQSPVLSHSNPRMTSARLDPSRDQLLDQGTAKDAARHLHETNAESGGIQGHGAYGPYGA